MSTTKQKVDVKAIMAKAKNSIKKVNNSTDKIESKKDTYRIVLGFSKYEFNGSILRNFETKRMISLKAKNGRYQIISDEGKNCDRTKEQIKVLLPAEEKKVIKELKEKVAKELKEKKVIAAKTEKVYNGVKHVVLPMDHKLLKPDALKIMQSDMKNYDQVISLHNAGYSKLEIIDITGRRNDVISKYLRPLLKK